MEQLQLGNILTDIREQAVDRETWDMADQGTWLSLGYDFMSLGYDFMSPGMPHVIGAQPRVIGAQPRVTGTWPHCGYCLSI